MANELEKTIGEGEEPTPPLEEKKPEETKESAPPEENTEVKKANEHLSNIKAAVKAEEDKLKKIREDQKKAKKIGFVPEEEEIPQIDDRDPSAKAWTKRINDSVAPAALELEKAKDERRLYSLRQFLSDKPSLAKSSEKIKEMMDMYDRIKNSTELTNEGITMDLEKAYAATHSEELIRSVRQTRMDSAKADAIFSDIGVSRGSTAYSAKLDGTSRQYSEDERNILAKWGMTPAEHALLEKEQKSK